MSDIEKQRVVMCDEIKLKTNLSYNKYYDFIEGYEDFDTLGRTEKLGDHGVVFYLRGLFNTWKMTLFLFYIGGTCQR